MGYFEEPFPSLHAAGGGGRLDGGVIYNLGPPVSLLFPSLALIPPWVLIFGF